MPIAEARAKYSGLPEMSENNPMRPGLERERDYGAAWRDCPSAFWLAPDATDHLPDVDVLKPQYAPEPDSVGKGDHRNDAHVAQNATGKGKGIATATLVAGPVFFAALVAIATPMPQVTSTIVASLLLAPLTIGVGGVLAILPVALGTFAMAWLGRHVAPARWHAAWWLAGALFGMTIAAPFGAFEGLAMMAVTGGVCAGIARAFVRWGSTQRTPAAHGEPARAAARTTH